MNVIAETWTLDLRCFIKDIVASNIVKAFDKSCVGTKVTNPGVFANAIAEAVGKFEFPPNGQGFVPLPCINAVSCGLARRSTMTLDDYVIREWRDHIGLYAKRAKAVPCENLAAIVYTHAAYVADPEITPEEIKRVEGAKYVLVAVLGSAGPKPPVGFGRFVRNLAGANLRYKPENGYTIETAIKEAQEIVSYEDEWITVAD